MGRLLLSLLITLGIISIIGYGGYLIYENKNLNEVINIQDKDIKKISYENERLNYKIRQQEELIRHYEKTNRELAKEARNARYKARNNYQRNSYQSNKIIVKNHNQKTYTKKKNNNQTYIKPKRISNKRYHRYTRYEKLVSDSKIRQRSDGRFVSNSAIYGIYKDRIISAQCGGNPKIYGVVNECKTYAPYSTDLLYFAKSNINELKTFNPSDHKIECHYDQKHGIMENCRAKIFKFIY